MFSSLGRTTFEQDAFRLRPLMPHGGGGAGAAVTYVPALVGYHGPGTNPTFAWAGGPEYNVHGVSVGVDIRGTGDGGWAYNSFAAGSGVTSVTVTPLLAIEDTVSKYATMANYVDGYDPATGNEADFDSAEDVLVYRGTGDLTIGTGIAVTVPVNYTNEVFYLSTGCYGSITASVVRVVGWLIE